MIAVSKALVILGAAEAAHLSSPHGHANSKHLRAFAEGQQKILPAADNVENFFSGDSLEDNAANVENKVVSGAKLDTDEFDIINKKRRAEFDIKTTSFDTNINTITKNKDSVNFKTENKVSTKIEKNVNIKPQNKKPHDKKSWATDWIKKADKVSGPFCPAPCSDEITEPIQICNYTRTDRFAHGDPEHPSGFVEHTIASYGKISISDTQQAKYPDAAKYLSMPGGVNWSPDKTCIPGPEKTVRKTYNGTVESMYGSEVAKGERRTAYLLTVDEHAPRAVQSRKVLEQVGFDVKILHALPIDNKEITNGFLSNKFTNIQAMNEMVHGKDPWYYLFEDDITLHSKYKDIKLKDIIAMEKHASGYMYLGICVYDPRMLKGSGSSCEHRKACGRCTHAQGFSRQGAQEFVHYVLSWFSIVLIL